MNVPEHLFNNLRSYPFENKYFPEDVKPVFSITYLPIIIFFVILVIGFLIGMLSATKSSLYFLIWNIVFLGLYYFLKEFYDPLVQNIFDKIGWKSAKNTYNYGIIYLSYIFLVNIFALNIYIFLRSKIKESVVIAKQNGDSIWKSRIGGGFISLITFLPVAVVLMEILTPIFGESDFSNFLIAYLLKYLTFLDTNTLTRSELILYIENIKN